MNFIKLFLKQIKSHPIIMSFFIFGYAISILMLSVSTSNIINMKNIILEKYNGIDSNSIHLNVLYSKDIEFDDMSNFFKDISSKSKIRFENIQTYFTLDKDKKQYEIISEYFSSKPNWEFPVIKGRYYTSSEISKKSKVALVGKNLKKYIYVDDGIEKIKIGGEIFNLIGIVGNESKDTAWDSSIFIPITAIPTSSKIQYFNLKKQRVILTSNINSQFEDLKKIKANILLKDLNATITASEIKETKNIFLNLVSMNSKFITISIGLIILSIINMMNLTSFWISDRKKEIAIRKSFGISNFNISTLLFTELFSITIITTFFCLIIQLFLSFLIKNILGYNIVIYKENFLIATILSLVTASTMAIIPILKALKIHPIEVLKDS